MTGSRNDLADGDLQALNRALGVAARRWRAEVQRRLRQAGLGDLDAQVLLELREGVNLRQQDLADRLGVSNTAVMQAVDKLEGAGLVERRQAADDRRSNIIVSLASATTAIAVIQAALRAVGGEALAELSAEDITTTLRGLSTMLDRTGR